MITLTGPTQSADARKSEIIGLLQVALDEKCRVAGSRAAERFLRQAEDVASEEPGLSGPLPKVVAFRLAHVLMRQASTLDELSEVDELLSSAARLPAPLNAIPRIVRLAVLERMRRHEAQPDPEMINRLLLQAHAQAVEAIQQPLGGSAQLVSVSDGVASLQSQIFNQLELATYFLGLDYAPLVGLATNTNLSQALGDPYSDLDGSPSCTFINNQAPGYRLRIPYNLAALEVQERLEKKEADVGFLIGQQGAWISVDGAPIDRPHSAFILAQACHVIDIRETLHRSNDKWRQHITRTKKLLRELLPDMADRLSEQRDGVQGFNRIRICGAVDEKVADEPEGYLPENPHRHI